MRIIKREEFPVELETEEIEILKEAAQLIYSMQVTLSDNGLTEYLNEENGYYFDDDKLDELYKDLISLQEINIAY